MRFLYLYQLLLGEIAWNVLSTLLFLLRGTVEDDKEWPLEHLFAPEFWCTPLCRKMNNWP